MPVLGGGLLPPAARFLFFVGGCRASLIVKVSGFKSVFFASGRDAGRVPYGSKTRKALSR